MITGSAKFKNHPCFKRHWSGLDDTTPITLIIGKNNTGKSHLLQFIEALCSQEIGGIRWDLNVEIPLTEEMLSRVFQKGTSGGDLGGYHWEQHGCLFTGKTAYWKKEAGKEDEITFKEGTFYRDGVQPNTAQARLTRLLSVFPKVSHPLKGKIFKHLYADRDIQPESASNDLTLTSNGSGATNIVRRFLNSSEPKYPRLLIQRDMLAALNTIFGNDGKFFEITVQHHDGQDATKVEDRWEIFLEQEHKGLVSLSNSGSGLKTIFLVLLHMLVVPVVEGKNLKNYVFAFEELENNLHPSMVRNLLGYIKSKTDNDSGLSIDSHPQIFLTTHSNVALDYFAGDDLAQVIHVSHDGESAKTQTIDHSSKLLGVIWDLGTRPSDLLQANGIIWVEGPSDRIYLNKWIELYSDGRLKEGRHYQCAFYGGGLLSNLQVTHDEDVDEELINLLKINPNVVVVSDSDRDRKGAHLKKRVGRIRDEFAKLDKDRSLHWILEAREIENYLITDFINPILPSTVKVLSSPKQFESFFPREGDSGYLGKCMKRKTFDKSKLAALTTPHMTLSQLEPRFDLASQMKKIVGIVEVWNR